MQFPDGKTKGMQVNKVVEGVQGAILATPAPVPTGLLSTVIERRLIPEEARTRKWRTDNHLHAECHKCKERTVFDPDRESRTDCCLQRMLASQPDFLAQKNRVTEVLESAGHCVLYLPKFHPELNPIERVWSEIKQYLRDLEDTTYAQLKINFDHAVKRIPSNQLLRYVLKTRRFMSVYEFLSTGPLAELVVKRFRSHRSISSDDLKVFGGELRVRLDAMVEMATVAGNAGIAEIDRIRRYLPELRRAIAAEEGQVVDDPMDGGEGLDVLDEAARRAAVVQGEQQSAKKRKAGESVAKKKERDRTRSKKRRLAKKAQRPDDVEEWL